MPDEQGILTGEEQNKIIEHLKRLNPGGAAPTCEICHTNNWGVMPHVVSPMPLGPMLKWKQYYPVCMIMCLKCGNTKFLNAMSTGVIGPLKQEEPQKPQESEKKEEAKSG